MPSWVLNPESQEYCNQDVSWPAFLFGAQVFLPSVCGCWQNLSPAGLYEGNVSCQIVRGPQLWVASSC